MIQDKLGLKFLEDERVLIVEKGSLCHYDSLLDLIVISKCYCEDPDLFNHALEHEKGHRRIQMKYGFPSALHHAIYDWKSRFNFMNKNYENYKKFMKYKKGQSPTRVTNLITSIVYSFLTLPTGLFQGIASLRIFWENFKNRARLKRSKGTKKSTKKMRNNDRI